MAVLQGALLTQAIDQLRYQPTPKRVRALVDGRTLVDSTSAMLVWEPRRVVPSYAVPAQDVRGDLVPAEPDPTAVEHPVTLGDGPQVLDPRTGFGVHTCDGQPLTVQAGSVILPGAAFRMTDPEVAGHVILDFDAFPAWLEEDEPIISHPHDPFARIDIRRSSRTVRVEVAGQVLADSAAPQVLFETHLPPRFYLPRDDVRVELRPSPTTTSCAYKGVASYWSVALDGRVIDDVAWSYEQPLEEAARLRGLVCFFDERTDYVLDGQPRSRPRTPWSD